MRHQGGCFSSPELCQFSGGILLVYHRKWPETQVCTIVMDQFWSIPFRGRHNPSRTWKTCGKCLRLIIYYNLLRGSLHVLRKHHSTEAAQVRPSDVETGCDSTALVTITRPPPAGACMASCLPFTGGVLDNVSLPRRK